MQALVLVGGEGTRLRPLTLTRPKPALTLVDRPFIRYLVEWLASHGVDDVVMACGFKPDSLRAALGDELPGGPTIAYMQEPEPLGTAGPVRLAADQGLLADRFLMLNGDLLTDLDLSAHIRAHSERGAVASLALYPVDDPSSYGLVRREPDGRVTGFLEKPDPAEIDTDEVNAGAYVLERAVADLIPAGRAVSIEREVFPRLVGQGLYGTRLEGYWMDIGTPERFRQASWDILTGRVATAVAGRIGAGGVGIDADAEVDPSAVVEAPALIDAGAVVGAGARVGPRAVIGVDARVESGAQVEDSIVQAGATIGAGARLGAAIVGPESHVEAQAVLGTGTVVGESARVGEGASLEPDSRVPPGAFVP